MVTVCLPNKPKARVPSEHLKSQPFPSLSASKHHPKKKNPHHEHQVLLQLHSHVGLSRLQSFLGVQGKMLLAYNS
jgi:hypothetical protein